MMNVNIYQTSVTPIEDSTLVQLYISDKPPDTEGASIRLALTAKIPAYETSLLTELEREAIKLAADVLRILLQNLAGGIQARIKT
jgi:hypothetical protein